jgi:hypothetical protein
VRDYWPQQIVKMDMPEQTKGSYVPSVQEMIILACDWYGIEPDIPLAIARLETGNFTSRAFAECNNVGGMSIDEEPITYDSLEDGVDAFVGNLARNYFGKGFDDVEKISKKYCPVNAEAWAEAVQELIREKLL